MLFHIRHQHHKLCTEVTQSTPLSAIESLSHVQSDWLCAYPIKIQWRQKASEVPQDLIDDHY